MTVLTNIASLVTVQSHGDTQRTGGAMRDIGEILNGAVVFDTDIRWVGHMDDLPAEYLDNAEVIDCTGQTVMPGFVDAHTHVVFAGSRAQEFAQRLAGKPYTEIAAEGGGILTTMNAVREAPLEEIVENAERLVASAISHGTTTIEIKSGYGLTTESELKLLEAAGVMREDAPINVHITFLGAHAIPPEFKDNPDDYVSIVIDEMLPAVKEQGLATACDVFTDKGFFTREQSERICKAAVDMGLGLHIHADEIANIGASEMAAEYGAWSADHLECTSASDRSKMKDAGTVAVLLPGTAYTLRLPYPDARSMIDEGLVVALATDCNPGSCYTENMQGVLSLACMNMGMSIEEAITAATINGAHALRMGSVTGSIEVGKRADIVIYDVPSYANIVYHFGINHAFSVWANGEEVA